MTAMRKTLSRRSEILFLHADQRVTSGFRRKKIPEPKAGIFTVRKNGSAPTKRTSDWRHSTAVFAPSHHEAQ